LPGIFLKTGEIIKWKDFEFENMGLDGPKIDKILIKKNQKQIPAFRRDSLWLLD
jgi:hypothetical protein